MGELTGVVALAVIGWMFTFMAVVSGAFLLEVGGSDLSGLLFGFVAGVVAGGGVCAVVVAVGWTRLRDEAASEVRLFPDRLERLGGSRDKGELAYSELTGLCVLGGSRVPFAPELGQIGAGVTLLLKSGERFRLPKRRWPDFLLIARTLLETALPIIVDRMESTISDGETITLRESRRRKVVIAVLGGVLLALGMGSAAWYGAELVERGWRAELASWHGVLLCFGLGSALLLSLRRMRGGIDVCADGLAPLGSLDALPWSAIESVHVDEHGLHIDGHRSGRRMRLGKASSGYLALIELIERRCPGVRWTGPAAPK